MELLGNPLPRLSMWADAAAETRDSKLLTRIAHHKISNPVKEPIRAILGTNVLALAYVNERSTHSTE